MGYLTAGRQLKLIRRALSGTPKIAVFKRDDKNAGIPNRGEQHGNIRWKKLKFASREELEASVIQREDRKKNKSYKPPFTFKVIVYNILNKIFWITSLKIWIFGLCPNPMFILFHCRDNLL